MQHVALGVFFSILVLEPCSAELTNRKHDPNESILVDALIDILESCYADRFSTVGLAGPAAGSIMKITTMRNTVISVTLVDETSVSSIDPTDVAHRHKLQVFAIAVANSSSLVKTLVQVKNSTWWNHMASFVLIDQSGVSHGCSNAYEILWEAWKMNVLNSKFICVGRTRGTLIYTFNPYTATAPYPWEQENTYKGINGHVWTLFVKQYREEELHCDDLDFDKTLDLGGYEICAALLNTNWWYHDLTKKLDIGERTQEITAQILRDSLNATWNPFLRPVGFKENETVSIDDLALEVMNDNCDVFIRIEGQKTAYRSTYPHTEFSVAILTQKRGNKSQLDKIISVLDRGSRFSVVVVLLITLAFFKFYLRKPMIPAILDLVLITCNAALGKIPQNLAPRMFLGSLFIFVVTIQGIYQGLLATLLTGNVRLRNIDSIEDLAHSDHTIYSLEPYRVFFKSPAFEGRFVVIDNNTNCREQALRDSKTACVGAGIEVLQAAAQSGLHISSKSIGTIRGVYIIRPDWPLEQRVNAIYARASMTGIADFLQSQAQESEIKTLERNEYEYQHQPVKVITLEQLTFAFVILAMGLGWATITFIVEVAFYGKAIGKPKMLRNKWYMKLVEFVFR